MTQQSSKSADTGTMEHSADSTVDVRALKRLLRKLLGDVKSGRLVAAALMTKGRLSRRAVLALAAKRHLKFSWNALLGNPKLYPLWRKLKFAVEGITLSRAGVASRHAPLIAALTTYLSTRPIVTTSSELFLHDAPGRVLYKEVTALAHSPFIWQLVGLDQGRSNYDYWSDADLVERGAQYASFTALKEGDDGLHRMVKGRSLERQVMRANPTMVNHFYIATSGDVCRSLAELVANNYLHLRGVRHDWEPRLEVCRQGSRRSMLADAYLHESGLFLECAQNLDYNRGSRRKLYAARMAQKRQLCADAGLHMVVVDGDRFTARGVLDVVQFAEALRDRLRVGGQDIGPPPQAVELIRTTHNDLRARLIQGDRATVMACLAQLGIDGIAKLQNHYAHILTCLRLRDDFQEIMDDIKAASNMRRWGHA